MVADAAASDGRPIEGDGAPQESELARVTDTAALLGRSVARDGGVSDCDRAQIEEPPTEFRAVVPNGRMPDDRVSARGAQEQSATEGAQCLSQRVVLGEGASRDPHVATIPDAATVFGRGVVADGAMVDVDSAQER